MHTPELELHDPESWHLGMLRTQAHSASSARRSAASAKEAPRAGTS
jgi:hypothetical protein